MLAVTVATVTVTEADAEHPPLVTITEYVVVALGVTTGFCKAVCPANDGSAGIELHRYVPPPAVLRVTGVVPPEQMVVGFALAVTVSAFTVTVYAALAVHPPTVTVTVYVVVTAGVTYTVSFVPRPQHQL